MTVAAVSPCRFETSQGMEIKTGDVHLFRPYDNVQADPVDVRCAPATWHRSFPVRPFSQSSARPLLLKLLITRPRCKPIAYDCQLLVYGTRANARRAGVGIVTVHQLEAGTSKPRRATLQVFDGHSNWREENRRGPGVRLESGNKKGIKRERVEASGFVITKRTQFSWERLAIGRQVDEGTSTILPQN
jgi:hypothetical protein